MLRRFNVTVFHEKSSGSGPWVKLGGQRRLLFVGDESQEKENVLAVLCLKADERYRGPGTCPWGGGTRRVRGKWGESFLNPINTRPEETGLTDT